MSCRYIRDGERARHDRAPAAWAHVYIYLNTWCWVGQEVLTQYSPERTCDVSVTNVSDNQEVDIGSAALMISVGCDHRRMRGVIVKWKEL